MIPHRVLGSAIVAWTLLTWGGRIGLLTGPDATSVVAWLRIAGSLSTGIIAGAAVFTMWRGVRPAVVVYGLVTLAVWGSSLVSVTTDASTTVAFKLVHTGLAAVSLSLAWMAVRGVLNRPERDSVDRSGSPSPAGR